MEKTNENQQENKTRQELYCHECGMYVQFTIDQNLDGNHVLECPKCGHEHCRIVKNGEITEDRWDSRNGDSGTATWTVSNSTITYTSTSTYDCYTSTDNTTTYIVNNQTSDGTTDIFLYQNWMNTCV